jgi:hypothetical protein
LLCLFRARDEEDAGVSGSEAREERDEEEEEEEEEGQGWGRSAVHFSAYPYTPLPIRVTGPQKLSVPRMKEEVLVRWLYLGCTCLALPPRGRGSSEDLRSCTAMEVPPAQKGGGQEDTSESSLLRVCAEVTVKARKYIMISA